MKSKWKTEKAILEKLILEDGESYESIGKRYGCSGTNIKKVSKRLGIILPKRRVINPRETFNKGVKRNPINRCLYCGKEIDSSKKYCDLDCMGKHKHEMHYKDFLEHPDKYNKANYNASIFKKDILEEQGGVCAICGCSTEWNGKPLVFVLDHIDGHASNNSRENLRLICPNCDSQTDTFKSKNKNGDRHYYRYHKHKKERTQETESTENPLNDES
jgi:hypothetical protein